MEVPVDIIPFFRVPLTPIRYFLKNICKKTGCLYAFIKSLVSHKVIIEFFLFSFCNFITSKLRSVHTVIC